MDESGMATPGAGRLEGRAAIVTGAARGIGKAIASRLTRDGAKVAGVDIDEGELRETMSSLGGFAVTANLRDPDAVAAAVQDAVDALGGLNILVNNAGVARDGVIDELTLEDWDMVLDLDLRSYFLMSKAALPAIRDSGNAGRIINISSRAYLGNPGQANYSAAKAGVIGLTRALSLELGRDQITVNAIAPGMIDTAFVRSHPKADAIIERAVKSTPLRRLGLPEDVAGVAAFLASDDAGYITGDVLHVTGGRY
jgi:3-oxoacyl-[acyl-carrier protein] reductase